MAFTLGETRSLQLWTSSDDPLMGKQPHPGLRPKFKAGPHLHGGDEASQSHNPRPFGSWSGRGWWKGTEGGGGGGGLGWGEEREGPSVNGSGV